MRRRLLVLTATALLIAGCAADQGTPATSPEPSATQSASPPEPAANGSVYATVWAEDTTILRYPIRADGSVGEGTELLAAPGDFSTFPGVVDGIGDAVLTGTFEEYWTADIALRSASTGEAAETLEAPRWCGGEGLTFNVCVLLDDTRLLRSSELGGEDSAEAMLTISSLDTGEDLAEFGPYPGLGMVLGTSDPDVVLLVVGDELPTDEPVNTPGTVQRLDLRSGEVTQVGPHAEDWAPLCAIGTDSVLGYTFAETPTAQVVGPASIGAARWAEDEYPIGCSADGAFVYLQDYPQPPDDEAEDTEPPNPPTTLERIAMADGSRESVLVLDPLVAAGPITR